MFSGGVRNARTAQIDSTYLVRKVPKWGEQKLTFSPSAVRLVGPAERAACQIEYLQQQHANGPSESTV